MCLVIPLLITSARVGGGEGGRAWSEACSPFEGVMLREGWAGGGKGSEGEGGKLRNEREIK